MICRLAAAALVALLPAAAAACPDPDPTILFHSCWEGGRLDVVLLPEDLPLPTDGDRLIVTGAYTSTESRGADLRKPVGLFVHNGAVINPNLGRMDGVLIVDPASGLPDLQNRTRIVLAGQRYDLTDLDQRRAFTAAARAAGLTVLQSHLLIVDGAVDVRPQEQAPVFLRRILFTDAHGFGIYQSTVPLTLYEAATDLAQAVGPAMALNLDMGSYDFCQAVGRGARNCGLLDPANIQKLSNLLMITSGG